MADIGGIDVERDASKGVWHPLTLPDGTVSDAEILLMGMDAPEVADAIARLQQSEGSNMTMPVYTLTVVIAAAKDCRNLENSGEAVVAEELPGIITKHKSWMLEQCFRVVADRTNYLGNSSGS